MERNKFVQELSCLKPDWLEQISSILMKISNKLLQIKHSKILPQIGRRDTGP